MLPGTQAPERPAEIPLGIRFAQLAAKLLAPEVAAFGEGGQRNRHRIENGAIARVEGENALAAGSGILEEGIRFYFPVEFEFGGNIRGGGNSRMGGNPLE